MPLLTISSSDRSAGSDSSFTINLSPGLRGVKYARLMQANFMNLLYNVTDGTTESPKNNSLSFRYGSTLGGITTYTIDIPMGNYNWVTMKAALESAALTATGAVITFDLNSLTQLITVNVPTNHYIQILPLLPNQGLNLMLGFSRSSATSLSQTSVTAPRCLNLSRYMNLYVIVSFLPASGYCSVIGNRTSLLGSIPLAVPFGSKIDYQIQNAFPIQMTESLYNINVDIIDDLGYPVALNTYISLVVDVQY